MFQFKTTVSRSHLSTGINFFLKNLAHFQIKKKIFVAILLKHKTQQFAIL